MCQHHAFLRDAVLADPVRLTDRLTSYFAHDITVRPERSMRRLTTAAALASMLVAAALVLNARHQVRSTIGITHARENFILPPLLRLNYTHPAVLRASPRAG